MADIKQATVPDIGDFGDVPVIELLVAVGDTVKKDQGLVTLESDKATMEVPAPFAGVIRELKVKVGDSVGEGAVVALIEAIEAAGNDSAAKTAPAASTAAPAGSSDAKSASTASEVQDPVPQPEAKASAEAASDRPAATASAAAPDSGKPGIDAEISPPRTPPIEFNADQVSPSKVPHASPSVRAFARELGVDLSRVTGSERAGRITRENVQAFVKAALAEGGSRPAGAVTGGGGLNLLPWPTIDFSKFGDTETRPLSRIKKISGANLARNWAMIPHVTQFDDADITEMEAFRKKLGEENKDVKVTPLVFLIKAVVAGLKAFPNFNASLDATGETLTLKKYFNVGIAVDTPDGLVVPVIRNCDTKGLVELGRELGEISAKARDKKLTPGDMSGGCFSISSLGGIGGTAFTPIVNAPEVAILGVSRSSMKPVWNGKEFEPRLILPLSLSYDHRVIDGADAARFSSFVAKMLGDIRRLLI
jgi:pyruvate dehydrogenase E2 component (dihydrolipoamide acetyltransferase)